RARQERLRDRSHRRTALLWLFHLQEGRRPAGVSAARSALASVSAYNHTRAGVARRAVTQYSVDGVARRSWRSGEFARLKSGTLDKKRRQFLANPAGSSIVFQKGRQARLALPMGGARPGL